MKVKLFPHQYNFVKDTDHRYIALIAGFGAGKSFAFCMKALQLAAINAKAIGDHVGIICEPTYPLINDVLIPSMEEVMDLCGISKYEIKKTGGTPEIIIPFKSGTCTMKMRSAENFRRLVGINAAWAGVDEMDTISNDVQKAMWKAINARVRQAGAIRQTFVTTTPEGFKFTYQQFVVEPSKKPELAAQTKVIRASSYDNKTLPREYIEDNMQNFSEEERAAWVNGEFINMTTGRIYKKFDRKLNNSDITAETFRNNRQKDSRGKILPLPTLHIGMDFNVGKMAGIVHIIHEDVPHAIDEIINVLDTEAMIAEIKKRYRDFENITVYPDSSGKNRSHANAAADTDITLLKKAGFQVVVDSTNPPVKDRITAMNQAFCSSEGNRKYFINVAKCPRYTECLERQTYDDNGNPDKTGDLDHPNDAGGYFIVKKYPVKRYQPGTLRLAGMY